MCIDISNSTPTFLEFVPQICIFANGKTFQAFNSKSLLPRHSNSAVNQCFKYGSMFPEVRDVPKNPALQRRAAFSRVSGETLWSVIE